MATGRVFSPHTSPQAPTIPSLDKPSHNVIIVCVSCGVHQYLRHKHPVTIKAYQEVCDARSQQQNRHAHDLLEEMQQGRTRHSGHTEASVPSFCQTHTPTEGRPFALLQKQANGSFERRKKCLDTNHTRYSPGVGLDGCLRGSGFPFSPCNGGQPLPFFFSMLANCYCRMLT